MALLELHHVSKTYRRRDGVDVRALQDVSLTVEAGRFAAIQGPSGCGKTTLLLLAGALLAPDVGEIRVAGQSPATLDHNDRAAFRASTIGFVFQQFHLVPYLSVLENVLAPSLASGNAGAPARAERLIEQFNLGRRRGHLPGELSTGERQRAALARALLNRPQLLLADEPTGNLDPENARVILRCLADFAREGGAVLLVSHDANATAKADTVHRMLEGRLSDLPPADPSH